MLSDKMLHVLLVVGALITRDILRPTWKIFVRTWNIGFKEGYVARVKAGHPLTPEEQQQLDEQIKKKLLEGLQD